MRETTEAGPRRVAASKRALIPLFPVPGLARGWSLLAGLGFLFLLARPVAQTTENVLRLERNEAGTGWQLRFGLAETNGAFRIVHSPQVQTILSAGEILAIVGGSNAPRSGVVQVPQLAAAEFFGLVSDQWAPFSPPPGMVRIPAGSFLMGSPATEKERGYFFGADETRHPVVLTRDFYMGKHEVTQREYLALTGKNPSFFITQNYLGNPIAADLNRPVEQVSWHDAMDYCAKLTASEQAAGRLPAGWLYRLPTEAEWEYACRAGTTTPFHYGNELRGGMANFWSYYEYDASVGNVVLEHPTGFIGYTTPVGSYAPNAFGLHDMHGNVWEWCLDWYGAYPAEEVIDPQGPATGSSRVFRGGSVGYYGVFCRSAARHFHAPTDKSYNIGIRVVLARVR